MILKWAGKYILTTSTLYLQVREKELEQNQEETRPLSDGSVYEQQLSAPVRKRDKVAARQQVCGRIVVFTLFL